MLFELESKIKSYNFSVLIIKQPKEFNELSLFQY